MGSSAKKRKRSRPENGQQGQPAAPPVVSAERDGTSAASDRSRIRPAKKHPRLLAAILLVFACWLAVLVFLAIRVNIG